MSELREEELDQMFQQAVSLHTSEDELELFHDSAVDEVTGARIKAHLRRCADCRERFEMMQEILASYHKVEVPEESLAQLKSLIASTRPKPPQAASQTQAAMLAALIGLTLFALDNQQRRQKIRLHLRGARAAAEKLICQGETEDDLLSWQIEEDEFGQVEVALATPRLDLEDHRLALRIGGIVKEESLKRLSERKLGCVFTISREERQQLSEGDPLVIESLKAPRQK